MPTATHEQRAREHAPGFDQSVLPTWASPLELRQITRKPSASTTHLVISFSWLALKSSSGWSAEATAEATL